MKESSLHAGPSVAAVVPCCNDGRFLRRAVSSLRQQSVSLDEIVLVDDGSTDTETIGLIDGLSEEEGIRLIRFAQNRGLSAARNAGISSVEVDYILLLDADDSYEPSFLEKALQRYEQTGHKKVGALSCHIQYHHMDSKGNTSPFSQWKPLGGGIASFLFILECNSCALLRKAAWEEVGGYDEQMPFAEEWDLWLRLVAAGWQIEIIPLPLHNYYLHGANRSRLVSSTHRARNQQMYEYMYQKHKQLYQRHFSLGFRHVLSRLRVAQNFRYTSPMLIIATRSQGSFWLRWIVSTWHLINQILDRMRILARARQLKRAICG